MLLNFAEKYASAGLSVIPVFLKNKKPKTLPPDYTWIGQQDKIFTPEELKLNFGTLNGTHGIAVVAGRVSGSLEIIDFDNHFGDAADVFREFISIPEIKTIITKNRLPYEKTAGGGYHLFYRCPKIAGNTKLAVRPKTDDPFKGDTLIETRGEGGYCLVAGSQGYELIFGDLESIAVITERERDALLNTCMSFDESHKIQKQEEEVKREKMELKKVDLKEVTLSSNDFNDYEKIWEHYNKQTSDLDIRSILESAGWRYAGSTRGNHKFRRPGKNDDGISATFNGEVFYCFTSNGHPFEPMTGYSKFNVFKMLCHNGDFKAAVSDLKGRGYLPSKKERSPRKTDPEAKSTGSSSVVKPDGSIEKIDDGFFITQHYSDLGGISYQLKIHRFIDFLNASGFRKFIAGTDFIFLRKVNNIVEEVQVHDIQNYCQNYLREHYESKEMMEKLVGTDKLWTKARLAYLKTLKDDFNNDTATSGWLYFLNYAVEVRKGEEFVFYKYEELQKPVWKRNIIQRNIEVEDIHNENVGEFEMFVENVCGKDPVRKQGLMSAIGYLLHGYKNPSIAKCIIFMDERIPEVKGDSNGGTGKSLVGNFISMYKNVAKIGVNDYRLKVDFLFEPVNFDTEIVIFDDANYRFPFDFLFPYITGSLEVNKKNKSKITIPFSKSPKFLITTNHTIGSSGVSAARRKYELEFADHYNEDFSPADDFGHNLFTDWGTEQQVLADIFALNCVQMYLEAGLFQHDNVVVNSKVRHVIDKTNKEFVEFMFDAIRSDRIRPNIEFNRKELFDEFKDISEDPAEQKLQTFSKWLSVFCSQYKLKIRSRQSHTERYSLIVGDLKKVVK